MSKTDDIGKKSAKSCKTDVILVIIMVFHSFAMFFIFFLIVLVEFQYLNNQNTNKHEILHVYIFYWWHVHNVVIFSLTLLFHVLLIVISTNNA